MFKLKIGMLIIEQLLQILCVLFCIVAAAFADDALTDLSLDLDLETTQVSRSPCVC